jgi:hypothetical protein
MWRIKSFFLSFSYIYFLHILIHTLRNHTIRLKNWTLWINSPLVTTEVSLQWNTPGSTINPTMDNISQGFRPPITGNQTQLQPSSYTDTLSTVQPQNYIHTHWHTAISISLLHITSYLQPNLMYFPCMTAAAYNITFTCKHHRTWPIRITLSTVWLTTLTLVHVWPFTFTHSTNVCS